MPYVALNPRPWANESSQSPPEGKIFAAPALEPWIDPSDLTPSWFCKNCNTATVDSWIWRHEEIFKTFSSSPSVDPFRGILSESQDPVIGCRPAMEPIGDSAERFREGIFLWHAIGVSDNQDFGFGP